MIEVWETLFCDKWRKEKPLRRIRSGGVGSEEPGRSGQREARAGESFKEGVRGQQTGGDILLEDVSVAHAE